jgi:hypothetical protein
MDRHDTLLPPAPDDTEPELPRLVEWDAESELYRTTSEHDVDTWRPTGHE